MTNMIQKAAEKKAVTAAATSNKPLTIKDYVSKMMPEIEKALPSVMTPKRFTRIVLSALSTTPKLQECTPASFLGAMMTAAQLGVEPNTPLGQAYLIPRWNGKKQQNECTFQLGYKGLIDLAYRSGQVSTIAAHTVYENDQFTFALGLEPKLEHVPVMTDRGKPIAFYAVYKTKDGGYGFEVMSVDDARAHAAKFSESVKRGFSSPWDTNFEEMAKKTVLKKVLKYAPLKTEFMREASYDGTVRNATEDDLFAEPVTVIQAEGEVSDSFSDETINTGDVLKEGEA